MQITVDKKSHYVENPNLAKQLVEKFTLWANSVPAGSFATLYEVMNFSGHPSGIPLGTWMDPFEDGGIEGLELLTQYGPTCKASLGMPKMVHKLF